MLVHVAEQAKKLGIGIDYRYRSLKSRSPVFLVNGVNTLLSNRLRPNLSSQETRRRLPSSGTVRESARASVGPQSHLHLGILTVRQVGLDSGRGGPRSPRAPHVPAVVAVMMMVMASRVMRVVVIVMIEMRRLRGRRRTTPVRPLLLLEISQPLVVTFELVAQQRVLLGGVLLVVLETTDAVQPL